ncbi:hypothetical protein [Frankia sp. R82]|nr:hypothetical protein [Frankia sp. R82]MCM3886286.1 hypothetical protein [Frankia sp. R82]
MLDTLTPAERLAFVLHDLFAPEILALIDPDRLARQVIPPSAAGPRKNG